MTQRQRWTDQQWAVGAIAVAAVAFAVLVIIASTAAAFVSTTIIDEPSATRYSHERPTVTADTHAAGQTCAVWFEETNTPQPSAHVGNTLELWTGGHLVAVMDTERSRGGSNNMQILGVVVGPTMTVKWVMGEDNVSSNGTKVSIDCKETPSTTTSPPTSTSTSTSSPPSTTTPTSTSTTSTTVPESSSVPPTVPTTSTTVSTPSTTPTVTAPPATVPVIPSGVPTGKGTPPSSPVLPLIVAALAVSAIGVGAYRVSQRGDG